jgi:predicted transcriptional regulator of viral defense system
MIKKLKRVEVEGKLKSLGLLVFTPQEFKDVFGVARGAASVFISHNRGKGGLFVKLRNGLYLVKDASVPPFSLANKIYEPSYISLATALSHYGIIPETVYAVTSVTTKTPHELATPKGHFIYQRIKKSAFTGYGLRTIDRDQILIAEPEKALADYLYFVDLKKVLLNDRLDLKSVKKSALIEFVKLFERSTMLKLIDQIYAEYKKPRKIY